MDYHEKSNIQKLKIGIWTIFIRNNFSNNEMNDIKVLGIYINQIGVPRWITMKIKGVLVDVGQA